MKGISHKGDAKVGSGKGDDERIVVKLNDVDKSINTIFFTVTLFEQEGQHPSNLTI